MIRVLALSLSLLSVWSLGLPALAGGPKADLWARWQAHDPASARRLDHSAWGRFLDRYLSVRSKDANRIDYAAVTPADKAALAGYLADLQAVAVSRLNRAEQLAFWVNLYNALTVSLILDHWPVSSIRDIDISPGLFADGPWGKKLVSIEGERLALDDIEHRILRPIWRDPRIHYAVNCASIGCPDLASRPYTADTADRMLTAGAEAYVNDPRGAHVDADGRLTVSAIYDWFIDDFGGTRAGVLAHLGHYAAPDLKARLAGRARIDGHAYDWRINAAR
ncbi:MAG: DUF547 domain-containing protein [Rhodospirillales bacterium CG15_BIG_FIL_POST_REV_8_21_14_020_66_15]|nr:MAG: DUF547 domain-containing protein [Rhodospirillales bacterium CG15_BIG_FIL_POST_REV_8_21_14_020_66_15]